MSAVSAQETGEYNVVTNNCEHFASWCRNDWAVSKQVRDHSVHYKEYGNNSSLQVAKVATQVMQVVVGVATIKVRPAIMLGMLCIEGAKRIGKGKKSDKTK